MHIHCSVRFSRPARLPSVSAGSKTPCARSRSRRAATYTLSAAAMGVQPVRLCLPRAATAEADVGLPAAAHSRRRQLPASPCRRPRHRPGCVEGDGHFEFMQYVHSKMSGDRIKETNFCTNAKKFKKNSQKSTENHGNETSKCDLHVSKRIDFWVDSGLSQ